MLRFCDSFDHYNTSQILRKYNAQSTLFATTSITSSAARFGSQGLRHAFTAQNAVIANVRKTLDNQATWIVGFGFRFSIAPGANQYILQFIDTSTNQLELRLSPDGSLALTRNGTVLAGSITVLNANQWYYIELKVTINNSTGSYELRVNGGSVGSASSLDTQNSANAYANVICIGNLTGITGVTTATNFDYADLYICDSTTANNNDFLGDIKVECLYPNGDGAQSEWLLSVGSTHYQLVDDNPSNDDTDYIVSSTVGDRDTYTFANMVSTLGDIKGIQISMCARKDDAGTRTIAPIVRQSSTNNIGTNQNLTSSYLFYLQQYDVNPATSSAFTISEVNADEFGIKLVA